MSWGIKGGFAHPQNTCSLIKPKIMRRVEWNKLNIYVLGKRETWRPQSIMIYLWWEPGSHLGSPGSSKDSKLLPILFLSHFKDYTIQLRGWFIRFAATEEQNILWLEETRCFAINLKIRVEVPAPSGMETLENCWKRQWSLQNSFLSPAKRSFLPHFWVQFVRTSGVRIISSSQPSINEGFVMMP